MNVRLLGPIEVHVADRPLALGGSKQRAVLAMLALQANRTVSSDRLSVGLWGERPPASAAKMVQLMSQLRKLLAGSETEIVTRGRGSCGRGLGTHRAPHACGVRFRGSLRALCRAPG